LINVYLSSFAKAQHFCRHRNYPTNPTKFGSSDTLARAFLGDLYQYSVAINGRDGERTRFVDVVQNAVHCVLLVRVCKCRFLPLSHFQETGRSLVVGIILIDLTPASTNTASAFHDTSPMSRGNHTMFLLWIWTWADVRIGFQNIDYRKISVNALCQCHHTPHSRRFGTLVELPVMTVLKS
jgi:hypothetical protein